MIDDQPACITHPAPPAARRVAVLAAVAGLALALLAAVSLLALHLFFEAGDRERLHAHLHEANALLARVDDTAALSVLPAQLHAQFSTLPGVAVRVQGAHGQPLYEQDAGAAMPAALLVRASTAPPAPLHGWREAGRAWRGSALVMHMPLEGAAPLTVAVAVDVQRQHAFFTTLGMALMACVLAGWLVLGLLAAWSLRAVPRDG